MQFMITYSMSYLLIYKVISLYIIIKYKYNYIYFINELITADLINILRLLLSSTFLSLTCV